MDLCCPQPGHEIFYLWVFFAWAGLTRIAWRCMCARKQKTHLSKQTHTNECHLPWKMDWITTWASVCIGFYRQRMLFQSQLLSNYDVWKSYHSVSFIFWTPNRPLFTLPETKPVFFSKTFLFSGTTISAAPPPFCPCAALKGFPSWRLSWWWGLSVYYWVFCFPNSLPEVASPLFEHVAWHAGSVSLRKKKKQGTWMHPPNAHLLSFLN